eukprot:CAMPEP_0194775794 /NCGR_PEP_ID=MMETSP0323_2-20130528/61313_1 /TAXON_ID=2866 ORGANISM="Crypthecodinium cohnii, Strain Seligo" /NCGR_SAMPLE_ID=MMETSP0323_2 /ASSEMBLY_ACC=CAM_ASM_000346 /LENGTH=111 /DNA_ID=CAMNT_0039711911 /DNA_START=128 /DNA_END=463 /DNA_ORIENTATION=+
MTFKILKGVIVQREPQQLSSPLFRGKKCRRGVQRMMERLRAVQEPEDPCRSRQGHVRRQARCHGDLQIVLLSCPSQSLRHLVSKAQGRIRHWSITLQQLMLHAITQSCLCQ